MPIARILADVVSPLEQAETAGTPMTKGREVKRFMNGEHWLTMEALGR